jgi:hypothetical protein
MGTDFRMDKEKKDWIEKFFRFGMISKGIVYCLLGIMTVLAAIGFSNETTSKTEAFKTIYEQPFGKFILGFLILGLAGYVALRLFEAIKDLGHKGSDLKAIVTRIGYAFSAAIYIALGFSAVRLLMGSQGGDDDSKKFIVTKVLSWPGGEWIVGLVALIVIGSGINQIYKGVAVRFMKKIKLIRSNFEKTFKNAGIAGYVSRGIVLAIIGYLLLHGAITHNPNEAQGTDQAFEFLEHTFGRALMGIVAFGLVAYGVFMFVKAKYQHLHMEDIGN